YLQSESDEAKNFTTTSTLLVDGSQQPSLASSLPKRLACALNVRGAVKSSASIKMPLKAVQCVRYYTYNDYLDENEDRAVDPSSGKVLKPDWYMWIKEPCQNVSVTIWYYFPDDE
uniref:Uncharacterized protein n=1 Tax=Romanomermis culicivorax TaxID=13658 RepID=A0A915KTG0_ROMCU